MSQPTLIKLGDALETLIDHRGKTPKKLGGDWTRCGHRVVSALNVKDSRVDLNDHHYVDHAMYRRWMPVPLAAGDVLLTSEAPLGEVAFLASAQPWCLGQRLFALRGRNGLLDGRYLFYLLQSGPVREQLMSRASGSTVSGIRQSELVKVQLALPPVSEQREVATTLGALDDKIESNRRVAASSRALCHALYVQACGGSTNSIAVADVATFHNNRRVPLSLKEREAMPGAVPYYGATGVFGHVADALFDQTLLLVGEDGSVVKEDGSAVTQYVWGPAWVNNHAHVMTGKGVTTELLLLAMERADVRPLITGAVQAKLSMGNLKSLRLTLPDGRSLQHLQELIEPHFAVVRQRADETQRLVALRDALLPELLSGCIRVPEASEAIDQALA